MACQPFNPKDPMKPSISSFILIAAFALGLAGCDNKGPVTSTNEDADMPAVTSNDSADRADTAAEAAQAEAARIADVAKAEATKAMESADIQGLIDDARTLLAEGNYPDATSILQQLRGQPLSVEQRTQVDDLLEQIQTALAAKAETDAGNLPNR